MTVDKNAIQLSEEIVRIWGKFMEYAHGKLHLLFLHGIPESFLPFPKNTLLYSFSIMVGHLKEIGNQRGADLMSESAYVVGSMYIEDEVAILSAAKNFSDPEWREIWIPNFKKFQDQWTKTQDEFMRLANCSYVGDKSAKLYHMPDCPHAINMAQENEIWDNDTATFRKQNMAPCDLCKPPE